MGGCNIVAENPEVSVSEDEDEAPASPTVSAVTPQSPPAPAVSKAAANDVPKVKAKHANQYTAKNLLKCNQPGYTAKASVQKSAS